MYNEKVFFIISMLQVCKGAIERDLLLTPKESLQILGRTLYYNPSSYDTNGTVPWEQTLKHVTFLTLYPEAGKNTNISNLREYKVFMQAPYTRDYEEYPRYGDIITMARGWVENPNGYRFNEGVCEEFCSENALAMWRVQKIRHHDQQRGFRFEMKFSVTPLNNKAIIQKLNSVNEKYYKSFILKDDEYPKSFNGITRRSDNFENFSNERQARIVNHDPREDFTHMPPLNIGEYFKQVPKASSKVGYLANSRNDLPTTYRPNYRIKFTKPEVYEAPEEPKTVVTHHFHHHYFLNEAESSTNRDQQLYRGNPDAIKIIEPPNVGLLAPRYVLTTTTEAPPQPPAVFLMQQIPMYLQSFPREETSTRPFRQSEQHFEEIRYSEPDPLYENVNSHINENSNDHKNSAEPASAEIHPQVERPNSQVVNSIIEEVPPPAVTENQEEHVTYADEKEESTTVKPTTPYSFSTRRTLLPKNKFFVTPSTTTTSSESPIQYATKLTPKTRNYIRSTTEQPVLKWKPKRKPKEKVDGTDSSAVQSNTEERVITVTPSKEEFVTPKKAEFEILTQKSVSKSISVKVGNRSQEIPLIIETATTTMVSNEEEGSGDIEINETES